ncbi:MAG: hypothetical protein II640_04200 [Lachnospiraceae bacterium]|nr:hypothetical protein [Lachnospiraceae bacterium]
MAISIKKLAEMDFKHIVIQCRIRDNGTGSECFQNLLLFASLAGHRRQDACRVQFRPQLLEHVIFGIEQLRIDQSACIDRINDHFSKFPGQLMLMERAALVVTGCTRITLSVPAQDQHACPACPGFGAGFYIIVVQLSFAVELIIDAADLSLSDSSLAFLSEIIGVPLPCDPSGPADSFLIYIVIVSLIAEHFILQDPLLFIEIRLPPQFEEFIAKLADGPALCIDKPASRRDIAAKKISGRIEIILLIPHPRLHGHPAVLTEIRTPSVRKVNKSVREHSSSHTQRRGCLEVIPVPADLRQSRQNDSVFIESILILSYGINTVPEHTAEFSPCFSFRVKITVSALNRYPSGPQQATVIEAVCIASDLCEAFHPCTGLIRIPDSGPLFILPPVRRYGHCLQSCQQEQQTDKQKLFSLLHQDLPLCHSTVSSGRRQAGCAVTIL